MPLFFLCFPISFSITRLPGISLGGKKAWRLAFTLENDKRDQTDKHFARNKHARETCQQLYCEKVEGNPTAILEMTSKQNGASNSLEVVVN